MPCASLPVLSLPDGLDFPISGTPPLIGCTPSAPEVCQDGGEITLRLSVPAKGQALVRRRVEVEAEG